MKNNKNNSSQSFILRFIKGIFIGSGFIIPGVSGGALAAIFGLYERIILFLANIRKNFIENVKFFLPVGIGALTGIVILSFGVSYVLENYETIVRWFFVGCIIGTAPALWKEAGKKGRKQVDYIILAISFILGFTLLIFGQKIFHGNAESNFINWIIAGALISLGILIPGLSPSNFILYMGLYKKMSDGFKSLDLSIIIPIGIGALLTIILLSKTIERIFNTNYSSFFHFIVGIVLASTLVIIPLNYSGFGVLQYILCLITTVAGILLGWWMTLLEEKYK